MIDGGGVGRRRSRPRRTDSQLRKMRELEMVSIRRGHDEDGEDDVVIRFHYRLQDSTDPMMNIRSAFCSSLVPGREEKGGGRGAAECRHGNDIKHGDRGRKEPWLTRPHRNLIPVRIFYNQVGG